MISDLWPSKYVTHSKFEEVESPANCSRTIMITSFLFVFYIYHLYCIIFYLYCIISICILYFLFVFYNVPFVLYNFLFVFYIYHLYCIVYQRDCLFWFVTMDFIGLMYPMDIITGKRGWHHTCPRQGSNPGRPRRNSAMLPRDQRSEPAGLVSNHSYILNPITLSIVMGGSKGEWGWGYPLGICGTQKNKPSNLKNTFDPPPLG